MVDKFETFRTGFCTTQSGDGNPKIVIEYPSLYALHKAHDELISALSLPVSNTGENAGLVKRLRKIEQFFGDAVQAVTCREAASALAAADARIAELEAEKSDAIDKYITIAVLGEKTIREIMGGREAANQARETAETLLDEAWRALAPFIRLADNVFSDGKNATVADEVTLWCFNDTDITFGDLRRARATLDRIGK